MDEMVLSAGERLTIRMIANKLKQVYGEGFLLENELIDGCYQLLASHAALAERLEEFTYQLRKACQEVGIPVAETGPLAASKVKDLAERLKEADQTADWWGDLVDRAGIGTTETPSVKSYVEQLEERLKACEAERDEVAALNDGANRKLELWGELVDKAQAERDTLHDKLKACEAERDHQWKMAFEKSFNDPVLSFKSNALLTPEEFVKEIERLFLKYTKKVCEALEAERDTLMAENARLQVIANAAQCLLQKSVVMINNDAGRDAFNALQAALAKEQPKKEPTRGGYAGSEQE